MNAAKRKLQSRRGASMLMALLLMLVALMVSAVILSAAISAVADLRAQKESQQAYLTASSAAQLFRDSVLDQAGQYTQTTTIEETYAGGTSGGWQVTKNETTLSVSPSGPYAGVMKDALKQIVTEKFKTFQGTYQITADGYDPVDMMLNLKMDYDGTTATGVNLLATFSTNAGGHPCKLTLTMYAQLTTNKVQNTSNNNRTLTTTITQSLRWLSDRAILETPKTGTEAKP